MLHATPRAFIVDPDMSVRASLEIVIRRAGWNPETFPSVSAFLARRRLPGPTCLLLDISPYDLTAFDLLRQIAADRKDTPVIAMSALSDIPMTVRAMRAGAIELLVKPLANDVLLAAVGHGIERSRAVLEVEAEMLELRGRYDSLSGREREVMAGVVAGHLNKHVAAALGISEITVKAHRGRVMRKMAAESLPGLVLMAMRLGLPTPRALAAAS